MADIVFSSFRSCKRLRSRWWLFLTLSMWLQRPAPPSLLPSTAVRSKRWVEGQSGFHIIPVFLFSCCNAIVLVSRALQTHYVISEGQTELDGKQVNVPSSAAQVHLDPMEQPAISQQTTTQYIITTTTNGAGASEVHITKPWPSITREETDSSSSAAELL